MNHTAELLERFWAKVVKSDACWEWTAAKSYGYGRFKVAGRMLMAHRLSWSMANDAEVPDGLEVDHMCFNHACVNPAHLRLLSRSENAAIHPPWKKPTPTTDFCPRGHDKRLVGRTKSGTCLDCQRAANRTYMRRVRAAA